MERSESLKYRDNLTVVGISILTDLICEAISWLLIYRTASYKTLKFSFDKTSKKLESMKTTSSSSSNPNPNSSKISKSKKMERAKSSLKDSTRDLILFKFKSGAILALVLFVVFGLLNSLFDGKPVAKLPFYPFSIVLKMSHGGLPGSDPTDCSMAFLSTPSNRSVEPFPTAEATMNPSLFLSLTTVPQANELGREPYQQPRSLIASSRQFSNFTRHLHDGLHLHQAGP